MDRADASIYHLIRKSYYNKYFIEPACSVGLGEMLSVQKKKQNATNTCTSLAELTLVQ